jgi:AcrR family transcriptional regulator
MPRPIRRRREGITIARPRSAKHVMDKDLWSEGRERIAAAALPLFLKYGYHATPVRVVARAAGLSAGSIFNYFAGKDEILKYILDESHAQAEAAVAEAQQTLARSTPDSDPIDLFERVYRRYARSVDAIRRYALLAYQEAKSLSPRERAPLFEREHRIAGLLAAAAQPAIDSGVFSPEALPMKVQSLIVLAHAWAVRHWAWPQYPTIDDYLRDLEKIAVSIMTAGSVSRRSAGRRTAAP